MELKSCCTALGTIFSHLWWSIMEDNVLRKRMYVYICMCDWVTLLCSRKLTEHCKPTIMEKIKIIKKPYSWPCQSNPVEIRHHLVISARQLWGSIGLFPPASTLCPSISKAVEIPYKECQECSLLPSYLFWDRLGLPPILSVHWLYFGKVQKWKYGEY